jgi:hypothetical protein
MQAVKIRDLEPGGPTGQFRVELLHGDLARVRPTTPDALGIRGAAPQRGDSYVALRIADGLHPWDRPAGGHINSVGT